jgi:hypothetical protein
MKRDEKEKSGEWFKKKGRRGQEGRGGVCACIGCAVGY